MVKISDAKLEEARKMHAEHDAGLDAAAKKLRKKFWPVNMQAPLAVKIREWNGTPMVGGCHLTARVPGARKLLPGEVVVVDARDPDMAAILEKEVLQITRDKPNRPVVFDSKSTAKWTDRLVVHSTHAQRDPQSVELAKKRRLQDVAIIIDELNDIEEAKRTPPVLLSPEDVGPPKEPEAPLPEAIQNDLVDQAGREVAGLEPEAGKADKEEGPRPRSRRRVKSEADG